MGETRKRDINLSRFNLSRYAYRELEYFCLQYNEKKSTVGRLYDLKERGQHGIRNEDKIKLLENDIRIIDEAAKEADESISKYILKNTVDGIKYEYLDVPCGRRRFYEVRRNFLYKVYCKRCEGFKKGN